MSIVEAINDLVKRKMDEKWSCHCGDCMTSYFNQLTDDELIEVLRPLILDK